MSEAIHRWLVGDDTGLSSKALAGAALGIVTPTAKHNFPHDGGDFGRCHRLMELAPAEVREGLRRLAKDGGPYWAALAAKWDALTALYLDDQARRPDRGDKTYRLIRSIIDPIEAADKSVVRLGPGMSVRFGQ